VYLLLASVVLAIRGFNHRVEHYHDNAGSIIAGERRCSGYFWGVRTLWTFTIVPSSQFLAMNRNRRIVTIAVLARLMAPIIGFNGRFVFEPARAEGTERKLLDISN